MSPLKDIECSCTTNDFLHLYNYSNIKLDREPDAAGVAEDELEGATMVPPTNKITPRLVILLHNINTRMANHAKDTKNQPPPTDVEVDQVRSGDMEVD